MSSFLASMAWQVVPPGIHLCKCRIIFVIIWADHPAIDFNILSSSPVVFEGITFWVFATFSPILVLEVESSNLFLAEQTQTHLNQP